MCDERGPKELSRMTEKGGKPIRRKEKNHLDQFGNLLRMDF